jgi:hypothetical protein
MCGFNRDSAGHCMIRKGDTMFTEAFENFKAVNLTSLDCHVMTDFAQCKDVKDKISTITEDWLRMLFATDEEKGWANYAHNDKCIAESITADFWQSKNPNSAYGSIGSAVLILILSIIAI